MSVFAGILTGVLMGIVFGFALEKGRVFEPGIIVDQMRLKRFIMLKMFLTGVAVGLVVLAILVGFGLTGLHVKPLLLVGQGIGGLLLGVGITLAGACPGTVWAQIGAGYKDAWFTLLGGLAGAMVYAVFDPVIAPNLGPNLGKMTVHELLGLPFAGVALALAAVLAFGLYKLEKARPWRDELGKDNR